VVFDREKFKSLVHYIIARAGNKPGFGATKLNKVLWFADARLFMLRGKPITGAAYIREKWGPVPQQIMPVRDELVKAGAFSRSKLRTYRFSARKSCRPSTGGSSTSRSTILPPR
jgi:hypothetical protein